MRPLIFLKGVLCREQNYSWQLVFFWAGVFTSCKSRPKRVDYIYKEKGQWLSTSGHSDRFQSISVPHWSEAIGTMFGILSTRRKWFDLPYPWLIIRSGKDYHPCLRDSNGNIEGLFPLNIIEKKKIWLPQPKIHRPTYHYPAIWDPTPAFLRMWEESSFQLGHQNWDGSRRRSGIPQKSTWSLQLSFNAEKHTGKTTNTPSTKDEST